MRRSSLFPIALVAAIQVGACTSDGTDGAADDGAADDEQELVSDGATGGTVGFYFLPPTVRDMPAYSGMFDSSLSASLVVEVRGLDCSGAGTVGAVAYSADRITAYAASESYRKGVDLAAAGLTTGACYRIVVKKSGAELGYRDVIITVDRTSPKPAGYLRWLAGIPQTIAFRIERGGGGGGGGGTDPVYATAHPRIYLERNKARLTSALANPAGVRFKTMVNGQIGGADYWDYQQWFGALLSQLTGQASYCTYAVDEIDDYVSAEEARIASGTQPTVANDSYLEVGPKIGDIMLTYDWCYSAVSASQRTRWHNFAAQAVWNVWHPQNARWGSTTMPWSGWSVDNPSNNYYYSFLTATMMFGLAAHDEHPDAAQYLAFFRDTKIRNQLVPTFAADLAGGGSREGTGYGTAMKNLWRLYEMWKGSTGEDLSVLTDHARDSLVQMLHAAVPTRDRIAPIGDQARDSTAALFDYHREYITALATLYPTDPVVPKAKFFLSHSTVTEMDQGFEMVWDFLYSTTASEQSMDTLGTVFHAPGNGVVYARASWDPHATWLNLIAGPYTESHAHRDQGSFMVFKDEWLAYDAVVDSHSGIRQEEQLHNLVRIDSGGATVHQHAGTTSQLISLARGNGWVHMAADLTPAYAGDPAVQKVQRELVYLEPDCVIVFDRVTSSAGTQQVWMLNSPKDPAVSGTRSTFTGNTHALKVERVIPASASASVFHWASDSEFGGGHRLDETIAGGANQMLHVMWTDGAVGTVTRSDLGGRLGVTVALAGGKVATVRFGTAGVDGTLEIVSGGSTITRALVPGVQTMAE